MHALVALSNKQLGETLWHYLKEFGAGMVQLVARPEDAVRRMHEFTFTHFFIDYDLGDNGGADFARFVRLCDGPMAQASIILIMPQPSASKVFTARDAGVNEILGLPLTAKQLDTRLKHLAVNPKPFVRASSYIGPCRRREVMSVYHGVERRTVQALHHSRMPRKMLARA
jgi:two-component system chemotaxis response regulator CheY